ncbi:NAD-dependent epimerase/dehydratase family protein [Aestuariibacter salexigens]|uniref:NAD-dependent epimerase/dehydratase family protein n=1 Tax=Aestuariibacter salexigens TaxID=226010 RepID=UPI00041D2F4E|nr:NAD(P)-dependent oxidoreductase [Aestuariibacter salexigens]
MKVLITGGAGYIGLNLVSRLAASSAIKKITIYDTLKIQNTSSLLEVLKGTTVSFKRGDILDNRLLKAAMKEHDTVIHLAAVSSTPLNDEFSHQYEHVNHWGTASLVDAIEETSNVKQVIFLSTCGVYGAGSDMFSVSDTTSPIGSYAQSKYLAENQIKRLYNRLPSVSIIRVGTVFGHGYATRYDSVVNLFLSKALFGEKLFINGDGNQVRPFLHLQTMLDVFQHLLESKSWKHRVFNLVDFNLSINEVKDTLFSHFSDLQYVHVNRELKFRSLTVKDDSHLGLSHRKTFEELIKEEVSSLLTSPPNLAP